MKKYDVLLETTAVNDLYDILDYITNNLMQPETAKRIFYSIEDKISTLDQLPARHNVVREEPYAALGVRMLPVENYVAFYIIDEPRREVRVLRILYNRREWKNLL